MKLLFIVTDECYKYTSCIKPLLGSGNTASVVLESQLPLTLIQLELHCIRYQIDAIISTSPTLLRKLLSKLVSQDIVMAAKINNYAGSIINLTCSIEILFIHALINLTTISYQPFLTERYISKITAKDKWIKYPKFEFNIISYDNYNVAYNYLIKCDLISIDTETIENPLAIKCVGFTGVKLTSLRVISYLLPIDSEWSLIALKNLVSTPAPKVFQNGKYDLAYLLSYNIIVFNYLYDTATALHCWYSELPKDLGAITTFFVRDSMYWKDLANTGNTLDYYKYCALDTWGTAMSILGWMYEAPQWAKDNYIMEFPLLYPCLLAEMTGLKRDNVRLIEANTKQKEYIEVLSIRLDHILGTKDFNVMSNPQMKKLLHLLGCKDLESADENHLMSASSRHPIITYIIDIILEIRGARKLVSTYLKTGVESIDYKGRLLYSLNPHGTDTGRLASNKHAFWCGANIQNIPRGDIVKSTIVADKGFILYECDLCQAESRDTAYIVGDVKMIEAVTGNKDYHSLNASKFFGVPYENIYCDDTCTTINKKLRDLSKRVNHGANYNMGWRVLIQTMTIQKIREAAILLKLLKKYSLKDIAEHLLACFHKTYPGLQGKYYPKVVKDVLYTKKLVGATGWTRYCFGDPSKSKRYLNAYVAHCPQSLNAMVLNKAWLKVFYNLVIGNDNFKLNAQIHDSILFQVREGYEHLAEQVKECMEIEVTCKDVEGTIRKFTVPAELKRLGKHWSGEDHGS